MKRLIALLILAALCVTILSPPVASICPDPSRPVPWMDPQVRGEADEGGWNDLDSNENDGTIVIFGHFKLYGFRYIMISLVPKTIEKNNILIDNERSSLTDTGRDRGTSPE
jgi:hypothetical protein